MAPTLSVLMPVFNEVGTVREAIQAVLDADLPDLEIIVVDDGSTDGTSEVLEGGTWDERVRLLKHDVNQGKGAAVRTALAEARGRWSEIFDTDLEYEPEDIRQLLAPLEGGLARACFGVRAFDGYASHSFLYVMGNRGVTLAANVLFNVYLRDIMTCHKAIETDLFRSLSLRARGFDLEPEIAARLVARGERIFEVPVRYHARAHEEGKKLTSQDGLRVVRMLLRCRLGR
jgi:dolichol-phosphate hexosyltransferase